MIFHRSIPHHVFRDYTLYRPLLRNDFQFRCAYCLTREYFLGGEAGCCIDHHRPLSQPVSIADYSNLYWCCRECNENKGNAWPTADQLASGFRFIDPCNPADDHDLHWQVLPDGELNALSPVGDYTIERLKLWRPYLKYHRAKSYRLAEELRELQGLIRNRHTP